MLKSMKGLNFNQENMVMSTNEAQPAEDLIPVNR